MTDSPAPLAYAMPAAEKKSPYRMLIAALAVAAGFLKANSFADAVGIPPVNDFNRDPGYLFPADRLRRSRGLPYHCGPAGPSP